MQVPPKATGIILAGGKGERMPEDAGPKCLSIIRGRTLLDHLIHSTKSHLQDLIVCTGHRGKLVEEWVRRAYDNIQISNAGDDAAIEQRILKAKSIASTSTLVICYGDTLADMDIEGLLLTHQTIGKASTITIYPLQSDFGIIELDQSTRTVSSFTEKPTLPYWQNIGFIVLRPDALDHLERSELPFGDFLREIAAKKEMAYHIHRGRHLTVSTGKDLKTAQEADWLDSLWIK